MGQSDGVWSHMEFMAIVTEIYGESKSVTRLDARLARAVRDCHQLTSDQAAMLTEALERHNPGHCDECCPSASWLKK